MSDPTHGDTAIQLSGKDENGRPILSVLAKRCYRVERGRCVPAEQQEPLVREPVNEGELLLRDADIFPYKLLSDVVLSGHAFNPGRAASFDVSLRVGAHSKPLRIQGDRRVTLDAHGRPLFSPPAPLESLPVSYEFAYGGCDLVAEHTYGNPAELLAPYVGSVVDAQMIAEASPFRYPRNPCGRGYIIEPVAEALDALLLPNIEDPRDLLAPERLLLREPNRWPAQPLAAGYGFLDYGWFPRCTEFGVVPEHDDEIGAKWLSEVRFGYAGVDVLTDREPTLRSANGAALGLALPHLSGDEEVELVNLHARSAKLTFRLPGERPKLWIDGREGKLLEVPPVLHTLHVDSERECVTVVWRGSALARRPYMEQELASMPFQVRWP